MTTEAESAIGGAITLGQHNYGKSAVHLVKVIRHPDHHDLRDLQVDVALEGDFGAAYLAGDNTGLLATDTMRNTIYALAKDDPIDSIEQFGRRLVQHFLLAGPGIARVRVQIIAYPWQRIAVNGVGHAHSFTRGTVERHATVVGTADQLEVTAGLDNLTMLKTTNSGWEGYLHEDFTTLPETHDRILATVATVHWLYAADAAVEYERVWQGVHDQLLETFTDHYSPSMQNTLYRMGKAVLERYPEIERIHFSFPNKHHLLFDLSRFGRENNNEIFHATSEPYGLIEGTVERRR